MEEKNRLSIMELDGRGTARGMDECENWAAGEKMVWIHMDMSEENKEWLREKKTISENFLEALYNKEGRSKTIKREGRFFISLRAIRDEGSCVPDEMVLLNIYITNNLVMTVGEDRIHSVERVKKDLLKGRGAVDLRGILYSIVEQLTLRIGEVVQDMDDKVDDLEDMILQDEETEDAVGQLRREIIDMKRYLKPQRLAFERMIKEDILKESDGYYLKEIYAKYERYIDDLESFKERSLVIYEEINSLRNEKLNRNIYTLSVIAGIFLPLSFITGLLGINVGGIPGEGSRFGFLEVCLILLAVLIGEVIIFKKNKWM